MRTGFSALLLGVTATILSAACNRVSWPVSRELCGQIQVVDKHVSTLLKNTDLLLYRSKSEYAQCCARAQEIGELRTNGEGNFSSEKLPSGRYFVAVKGSPEIVFPVLLEKDSGGGKCDLNTVFSFDRETGKTEQIVTVLVYTK